MADNEKREEKQELSDELRKTLKKLHLENGDWECPLKSQEILYLVNRCPFLQIVSTSEVEAFREPEFIPAKSHWTIQLR